MDADESVRRVGAGISVMAAAAIIYWFDTHKSLAARAQV
jgi:hypothetical protein